MFCIYQLQDYALNHLEDLQREYVRPPILSAFEIGANVIEEEEFDDPTNKGMHSEKDERQENGIDVSENNRKSNFTCRYRIKS